MSAKDFAPLRSHPVQPQPTPTPYIPAAPSLTPEAYSPPISQRPWTPSTSPSAFAPSPPQSPALTPDRKVASLNFLNRASRMSIDALNWAERKTREAAERQVERQIARHEANGTTVQRFLEDPREPRYLAERRQARFVEDQPGYHETYVSGDLKA